ncbi:MAG TPA: MFS transporter [Humisphaera sp.]|jgi:MFS family permease|nr:MFS transporter [Humisphaera sp.]
MRPISSADNAIVVSPASDARWLVFWAAFLGWMFDGLEMGIFPLVARPALLELVPGADDRFVGQWMGYVTALFLVGAALGGLLFGWLGDRFGRVRTMALSVLTYSIFTGLCFFARQPWHLGAFRFVAALGMGGEWSLGVALVMECWPEVRRPALAAGIGAASNVGFALIAVLGLMFKVTISSWRWVMLVGMAPAALTLLIQLFVPESEKWKQSTGERSRASAGPLKEVLSPPLLRITLLAIGFASIALIGTWGSVQWIPLWIDKLVGAGHPRAKAVSQILSASGAVVGCIIGALVAGRWGRRITYFALCLLSLLLCGWMWRGFADFSPGLMIVIFGVGAATAAFYGWLPLYLPELFPTRVRATGQGLGYNAGRIFAAVGAIYTSALVKHYDGSYARAGSVVTLIYVVGLVLIWFAPETRGRPLPE